MDMRRESSPAALLRLLCVGSLGVKPCGYQDDVDLLLLLLLLRGAPRGTRADTGGPLYRCDGGCCSGVACSALV